MSLFNGLSAFPITPTDADGQIDSDALCLLLDRLIEANVDSIGLLGSTGGYAYLDQTQRNRAVQAAVKHTRGAIPIIASVGALRTDHAVALAREAARAGADGLLLAPMSYTPLTEQEVFQHFAAVSDASSLPLCIYNNPSTTHFAFSMELLKKLSDIDSIQAVKMPLPADMDFASDLASLRSVLPNDFVIGYSGDWGCGSALLSGADAWFSVVGGILPKPALELTRAAQKGDAETTMKLNSRFAPLFDLFREFGSLRVVYAIANILQLTPAQPHLPVLPIASADLERVRSAIRPFVPEA